MVASQFSFLQFWQKPPGIINISQSSQVKNIGGQILIDLLNKPFAGKYKHKTVFVLHFSQGLENSGYPYDFSGHSQLMQTSSEM